jgi:hypothetical protein
MCDSAAWLSHPDDTIAFTAALLNRTHCGDLNAVGSEGQRVLACIRNLPLADILNLLIMHPSFHLPEAPSSAALPPLLPIMGFAPTLDSRFRPPPKKNQNKKKPQTPNHAAVLTASFSRLSPPQPQVNQSFHQKQNGNPLDFLGTALRVPYIIGTNHDEGSLFVPPPPLPLMHPNHNKKLFSLRNCCSGSRPAAAGAWHYSTAPRCRRRPRPQDLFLAQHVFHSHHHRHVRWLHPPVIIHAENVTT